MSFNIREYTEDYKDFWQRINFESQTPLFLTSLDWIEFQRKLGKEIYKYIVFKEDNAVGIFSVEINKRKFVSYGYVPSGIHVPEAIRIDKEALQELYMSVKEFLVKLSKEKKVTVIRFDNLDSFLKDNILKKVGFKKSLAPGLPRYFRELDLTKNIDELRADMSDSTRHNINKGEKLGLEVIKAENIKHVDAFSNLMRQTMGRKGFLNFNKEYFINQFSILHDKGLCDIYLAKSGDEYTAGALINYHNNKAYYTHGCSTSDKVLAKLRSPYFLQWKIITECKERGLKKYNMWGVLSDKIKNGEVEVTNNPLKGVSDFKKSFGGYIVEAYGVWEVYSNFLKYVPHRIYDWIIYRGERY